LALRPILIYPPIWPGPDVYISRRGLPNPPLPWAAPHISSSTSAHRPPLTFRRYIRGELHLTDHPALRQRLHLYLPVRPPFRLTVHSSVSETNIRTQTTQPPPSLHRPRPTSHHVRLHQELLHLHLLRRPGGPLLPHLGRRQPQALLSQGPA
jgi:hypothetical protein